MPILLTIMTRILCSVTCFLVLSTISKCLGDMMGPRFTLEPSSRLEFLNSTGAQIICEATGSPLPDIRWVSSDGRLLLPIKGLRDIRDDGTMVLHPFAENQFRPDVHDTVYRCLASNIVGSIASREIAVRAVLDQQYDVRAQDQYAIFGNTAVFRCHVSLSMREFVSVISWVVDQKLIVPVQNNDHKRKDKYLALSTGELYVFEVSLDDSKSIFHCRTRHRLNGQERQSSTGGKIILTDPPGRILPKIIDSRPKISAVRGQTVVIPCAAQGKPPPSITWHKNIKDKSRSTKKNPRFSQVMGVLLIRSVTPEDAGKYECLAQSADDKDKVETELTVKGTLEVVVEPHLLVVLTGGDARLNCVIQGYPVDSIIWMKDFHLLQTKERLEIDSSNILHISPVYREDQGMYQCFVHRGLESAQASAQITVADVSPSIQDRFPETTVEPHATVSLFCVFSGHPIPLFIWTLDGVPLRKSPRLYQERSDLPDGRFLSRLNVSDVKEEDGGVYGCLAQNNVGVAYHYARLNVYGPPFVRTMENVTVVEGENLVVSCPYGGFPVDPPSWEKGGIQLPISRRQNVYQNGTLVIENVHRDSDEGHYICSVSNGEKLTARQPLIVLVSTPPKIIPFDFPKRVREKSTAVITCSVSQGDSPFNITWMKNGKHFTTDTGVTIQVHDSFSILVISSVRHRHSGNYTCQVSNVGGMSSHSSTLTVDVPPRWVFEPKNTSVVMGSSVSIDCLAEGSPTPVINWKKSEAGKLPRDFIPVYNSFNYVVYSNGTIVIRDADETTAGFYLCDAQNNVGAGLNKLVYLTVHAPPSVEALERVQNTEIGLSVQINCHVQGDRPLEISWYRENQLIERLDERFVSKSSPQKGGILTSLSLSQATRNDTGSYTCRVSNSFGFAEATTKLYVQESPWVPRKLDVEDYGSRSITLKWIDNFNGHSPITSYILQVAPKDYGILANLSFPSTFKMFEVKELSPCTEYAFRLAAVNAIGSSPFSEEIHAKTAEEAPDGPPTDVRTVATGPNSLKVSWKMPLKNHWNGEIKGYYVGYKPSMSTEDSLVFKTVQVFERNETEVHLTNLKRSTYYAVTVQAFNSQGAGPKSNEIIVQTLEDVPPTVPNLSIYSVTSNSVTIQWSQNRPFGSPAIECFLYHRQEYGDWKETKVSSVNGTYTLTKLSCGTRYQLYMVSFNSVGRSEPSDIINVRTNGAAPLSPLREDFLSVDATSVTLNFLSWQNGGCPILNFAIKWRRKHRSYWSTVNDKISANQTLHTLQGLTPGQWHDLHVVAQSAAGSTESLYEFLTLNISEEVRVSDPSVAQEAWSGSLLEITVLIPVLTTLLIIVVIVIVGCYMCQKRSSHPTLHQDNSDVTCQMEAEISAKGRYLFETMPMKEIDSELMQQLSREINNADDLNRQLNQTTTRSNTVGRRGSEEGTHYSTPYDTVSDKQETALKNSYLSPGSRPFKQTTLSRRKPSLDNYDGDHVYVSTKEAFRPEQSYEALKPSHSRTGSLSYSVFEPIPRS